MDVIPSIESIIRGRQIARTIIRGSALLMFVIGTVCLILSIYTAHMEGALTAEYIPYAVRIFIGGLIRALSFTFPAFLILVLEKHLISWLIPLSQRKCPKCGYDLTDLKNQNCPECGCAVPEHLVSNG